ILEGLHASALSRDELARELYASWRDGRVKLFLTHAALQARKDRSSVFAGGGYVPLAPEGSRAANLCAFARTGRDGDIALDLAPVGAGPEQLDGHAAQITAVRVEEGGQVLSFDVG